MGLYDRDYTRAESRWSEFRYSPRMSFGLPQLTIVVKWLLIINVAVFFLLYLYRPLEGFLLQWFSVYPANLSMSLQLWRVITYQFLHGGFVHIFFNMLGLYFFGPMLEQLWGSRRFLIFYLVCGAMGGIFYPLLARIGWLAAGPMIGASGAILGIIAAAAILFPNSIVLLWAVFPMRLWVLAVLLAFINILNLLGGQNAGGDVAHLAGMAAGAGYVLLQPWQNKIKSKIMAARKESRKNTQINLELEIDRILEKVHKSGVHSLTSREKRTLKEATKAEQQRTRF
jgi:membrane associated rhomboid family serine protease